MSPTPAGFAVLVLARLVALVRALVSAGWPELSPWWSELFSSFMHAGARQLVVRCGRRGGKSSTACIFAVAFALVYSTLGLVPPGDVGWVVFVSTSREEADQRLKTIGKILTAIGVSHSVDGQTILLDGTNIGFRVQACTVASVSGWTSILIIADEVALWLNREDGSNPASEVLGALKPTAATQPLARVLLLSSPMGTADAHAIAFDAGSGEHQMVSWAPTWVANPTISEAETHRLEPDPRVHARQYSALAQAGSLAAFPFEQVDRASRTVVPQDWTVCESVLLLDPSAGGADSFTWAIARWRKQPGGAQTVLELVDIDGVNDARREGMTSDQVVSRVTAVARRHGVRTLHADQYERWALEAAFTRAGFKYQVHVWSSSLKEQATEHTRGWFRDNLLSFKDERTKSELLAFEERVSASGALTFKARGSSHDDRAMLLLLAAAVDIESGLPGSPSGKRYDGQGVADWWAAKAQAARGKAPSPLIVTSPEEWVELEVPPQHMVASTFYAPNGSYFREGNRLRVRSSDVETFTKTLNSFTRQPETEHRKRLPMASVSAKSVTAANAVTAAVAAQTSAWNAFLAANTALASAKTAYAQSMATDGVQLSDPGLAPIVVPVTTTWTAVG